MSTLAVRALPARPRLYGYGPDLPLGTYHVVQVAPHRADAEQAPAFTVQRTTGLWRWYPLTQRENPAWRTWRSHAEANHWMEGMGSDLCEWRHWGRG